MQNTKLMTLKDVKALTGYTHIMSGYMGLRNAGVQPVEYARVEGSARPVNLYREEDVRRVFADRLARVNRSAA